MVRRLGWLINNFIVTWKGSPWPDIQGPALFDSCLTFHSFHALHHSTHSLHPPTSTLDLNFLLYQMPFSQPHPWWTISTCSVSGTCVPSSLLPLSCSAVLTLSSQSHNYNCTCSICLWAPSFFRAGLMQTCFHRWATKAPSPRIWHCVLCKVGAS